MTTAARPTTRNDAHWYYADGSPCYELPKKDGSGMKVPTLADAKKLGLVPSVTTILKTLHKPELQNWIIEQAVLAVLTSPRKDGEAEDAYVQRILHVEEVQNQERDVAADMGKRVHAAMEDAFAGRPVAPDLQPWTTPAVAKLLTYGPCVAFERTVGGDGYAGRIDLIQQSTPDLFWIWDYKVTGKLPEKGAWKEHVLQGAAYAGAWSRWLCGRQQFFSVSSNTQIRTGNIYLSRTEPGTFVICEHDPWRTAAETFYHLVAVWQWMNNYRPGNQ